MIRISMLAITLIVLYGVAGCEKATSPGEPKSASTTPKVDDHSQKGEHVDGGARTELGSATAGRWTVKATRAEGAITEGSDPGFDLDVTGGSGTVSAVRVWIGTEDASGSVKSLAEVEDAVNPAHRHAHVEVPKPMPEGSKLWVEVEDESGAKNAASFDLKK